MGGMELDPVEQEMRCLWSMRARWTRGAGPSFSPLENIDGSNPTVQRIYALLDSPLCWPEIFPSEDARADWVLNALLDVYEKALSPWDEFRTVFVPRDFMFVCEGAALSTDAGTGDTNTSRWPYGTFPASIQASARSIYWHLKSSSRFSSTDAPSKWGLDCLGLETHRIEFRHVVGLAVAVCVSLVLDGYERALAEWELVLHRVDPSRPFAWLAMHDSQYLAAFLSAYVASPLHDQDSARELETRQKLLLRNAEDWLGLLDVEDAHKARIEQTAVVVGQRVAMQTRASVKGERANQARQAAAMPRKKKVAALTPQIVADYFGARLGQKWEPVIAELAGQYEVSESTVARRYKEAREQNLLSAATLVTVTGD